MPRYIAPAGMKLGARQIVSAIRSSAAGNGWKTEALGRIGAKLDVRSVLAVNSGRAALYLILKSLARLRPGRTTVALPAFTCFTVPAAVVRAGLKVLPVEIDPGTLDFDYSHLEKVSGSDLLAVVTSNLFGFVNDVPRALEVAHGRGAFLVDDAAQALGASRNGHFAGTLGDVGLYSLGRGKALAAMEGGLAITNDETIAATLRAEFQGLPQASLAHGTWIVAQMFAYAELLSPGRYWIPNSLPFLKLGVTEFDPTFRVARIAGASLSLVQHLLEHMDEINQIRRRNAERIAAGLQGSQFTTPLPAPDSQPTYIRFPAVAADRALRDEAVRRLQAEGFGATAFYPTAICDIPGIERHMANGWSHRPKAEDFASRLLTLPTHFYLSAEDADRMVEILKGVTR